MKTAQIILAFCVVVISTISTQAQTTDPYHQRASINPVVLVPKTPQDKLDIALFQAARHGNSSKVKTLLDKGANPNYRRPFGRIHRPSRNGKPLPQYTNVMTVLMAASGYGNPETIRVLIKRKAALEAEDTNGMTALMWASVVENEHNVRELLKYHPNILHKDKSGIDAIFFAKGHPHITPLLEAYAKKQKAPRK